MSYAKIIKCEEKYNLKYINIGLKRFYSIGLRQRKCKKDTTTQRLKQY